MSERYYPKIRSNYNPPLNLLTWRQMARQCAAYLIATKQWEVLEKWLGLYNGTPCWQRSAKL